MATTAVEERAGTSAPSHGVTFSEALRVWTKVALLSFGGPAAQIAVMHRILVDEKHWISENRFLYALNYCMLLPGPEAKQLAVYIGWLMHRTASGIMAGSLFVLPGVVSMMALSYIYAAYGNVPLVVALFFGLKAAVLRLRGPGLCGAGSRGALPLAQARRDARRSRHGRDNARPAHHGSAVRGVHGGVPRRGCVLADARRHAGRPAGHLGHVRSLLPVDFSRRSVRRDDQGQQGTERRDVGDHGRGGRGGPEPRDLVRNPHHLP